MRLVVVSVSDPGWPFVFGEPMTQLDSCPVIYPYPKLNASEWYVPPKKTHAGDTTCDCNTVAYRWEVQVFTPQWLPPSAYSLQNYQKQPGNGVFDLSGRTQLRVGQMGTGLRFHPNLRVRPPPPRIHYRYLLLTHKKVIRETSHKGLPYRIGRSTTSRFVNFTKSSNCALMSC